MKRWHQLKDFGRNHWFEVLLWVLSAIGIGGIIAMLGSIVEAVTAYPAPIALLSASTFFLGVLFSYLMGIRDRMKDKREAKLARERELENFTSLTRYQKAMLFFAYEMADPFTTPNDIKELYKPRETLLILRSREMVGKVSKSTGMFGLESWAITKSARKFLTENDEVRKEFEAAWLSIFEEPEDEEE